MRFSVDPFELPFRAIHATTTASFGVGFAGLSHQHLTSRPMNRPMGSSSQWSTCAMVIPADLCRNRLPVAREVTVQPLGGPGHVIAQEAKPDPLGFQRVARA